MKSTLPSSSTAGRAPQRGIPAGRRRGGAARSTASLAPPGELEQRFLAEAVKRALQHAGEGEIVLGQQQEIGERHHVLDRELVGQVHAVDPGDLDAALLQGAHQRADEGVRRRTSTMTSPGVMRRFLASSFSPRSSRRDPGRHRQREPRRRHARFGDCDHGRVPGFGRFPAPRPDRRPQLDQPGLRPRGGHVADRRRRASPRRAPRAAANTASTVSRTAGVERNEISSSTRSPSRLRRLDARSRNARACAGTRRDRRAGS